MKGPIRRLDRRMIFLVLTRFFSQTADTVGSIWNALIGDSGRELDVSPELPERDAKKLASKITECIQSRDVITQRTLAAQLGTAYSSLNEEGKRTFLLLLVKHFGPEHEGLQEAVKRFEEQPDDPERYKKLLEEVQAPRMEMLKQLNALPNGFEFLVEMRGDCLRMKSEEPALERLVIDLKKLFHYWFDVNLLEFQRLHWDSSASVLEKLMQYESVHRISDWEDLKDRLDQDRRCYALMHPKMPKEPLIFVEVALTDHVPEDITSLLDPSQPAFRPEEATTAVFYSISNSRDGLRGVNMGSFLLKKVIDDLNAELPQLERFVTLSPLPRFRDWLVHTMDESPEDVKPYLEEEDSLDSLHEAIREPTEPELRPYREPLQALCAHYVTRTRREDGLPKDPVARFHLKNGAELIQINWGANLSEDGLKQSLGMMVNYQYEQTHLQENHRRLMDEKEVVHSSEVGKLLHSNH